MGDGPKGKVRAALLSRALKRTIIAAGGLNGRVRDGDGCHTPANGTNQREGSRPWESGTGFREPGRDLRRGFPGPPGPAPRGGGLRAGGAQASRPIRSGMLNASRRLDIRPVKRVVFPRPSGTCVQGRLISGGAWRLDAFSAYPFATWLPGGADGSTTGTPEVARPRSSRTRGRSRQPSCACGG